MTRIEDALTGLRRAGRWVIRIVDNKCGDGSLLIRSAERATALGFVAVEARGFDRSPDNIAAARAAAAGVGQAPGVRLIFVSRAYGMPIPFEDDTDLLLADPDEDTAEELRRLADLSGVVIEHSFASPA